MNTCLTENLKTNLPTYNPEESSSKHLICRRILKISSTYLDRETEVELSTYLFVPPHSQDQLKTTQPIQTEMEFSTYLQSRNETTQLQVDEKLFNSRYPAGNFGGNQHPLWIFVNTFMHCAIETIRAQNQFREHFYASSCHFSQKFIQVTTGSYAFKV